MITARQIFGRSGARAQTLGYSEMPRYMFRVGRDGRDTFPVELPDRKSVRGEAIRAAGEILRDIDGALTEKEWCMVVKDESGELVLELRFSIREKEAP